MESAGLVLHPDCFHPAGYETVKHMFCLENYPAKDKRTN